MINISLLTLSRGELGAKFNYALKKVIKNILDPNTPYKDKRSITIRLEFETDEDREAIDTSIMVKYKLADARKSKTRLMIGRIAGTDEIYVSEIGASIPGQMSFLSDSNEAGTPQSGGDVLDLR